MLAPTSLPFIIDRYLILIGNTSCSPVLFNGGAFLPRGSPHSCVHHGLQDDDPWWDSPPPQKDYYQWFVTDKCYYWIDKDYKRSWRLDDMRIEFDDYKGWNFSADPLWKEYKKECEHMGPLYGRNDKAAQLSSTKLIQLINQHLK